MQATTRFSRMDDQSLMDWFCQYGQGRQAPFYRQVPRRAAAAEMRRRGLTPRPDVRVPRPRGYDTPSGYLHNWGLGG